MPPPLSTPLSLPRAALDATIKWIDAQHDWEHFVTLTFAKDVSRALAFDALHAWLRTLAEAVGHHVWFMDVMGPQPSGRLHFHVLLSFGGNPGRVGIAEQAWSRSTFPTGRFDVIPYRGCESLVVGHLEYMLKGHEEWGDANVVCPRNGECKRRHGCVVATRGWKR